VAAQTESSLELDRKQLTMAPLKPGDYIWSKSKPRRKGTITAAAAGGKRHEWIVQFEGEETTLTLKSQQLLQKNPEDETVECSTTTKNAYLPVECPTRPAAARAVPMLEETDVSSSHNGEEEEVSDLLNLDERLNLDDSLDEDVDEADIAGSSVASSNINDFTFHSHGSDDEDQEEEHQQSTLEEMIASYATNTNEDEAEDEDVPPHGEIPVEPEDVHRAKWDQYLVDKAQLLSEGWVVTKVPRSNESICVGATVRTKHQRNNRREGTVIKQLDGVGGRKLWVVDFGGSEEPMRPQQLSLVQRGEENSYTWILTEDSEPDSVMAPVPKEYTDGIGLVGFNFDESFKPETGVKPYDHPYLRLLQTLWPGDWKQQQRQLNLRITATNTANVGTGRQKINLVSVQEWWVFIGILISAGPQGKGGMHLWEKPSRREGRGMTHFINYGPDGENVMAYYRFREIKADFPWSFQDKTKAPKLDEDGNAIEEDHDPWHMTMLMVEGYNKKRHDLIAASVRKTLDESMSAWCPQTSKTGGLPHLSFILRKPEPLGTEFKTIACTATGKLPSFKQAPSAIVAAVALFSRSRNPEKKKVVGSICCSRVITVILLSK
jgi:hypothetical protein